MQNESQQSARIVEPAEWQYGDVLPIPNHYHFVWFGRAFPVMNYVAVASCVEQCKEARITLWHSDPLDGERAFRAVRDAGVETRLLDENVVFDELEDDAALGCDVPLLKRMWREVRSHVTRSNLARVGLVRRFGGIYLDMDVLVIRDLAKLRRLTGFAGTEHIVWPARVLESWSAERFIKSPLLDLFRKLSSAVSGGDQLFLKAASRYPRAANGAVLGAPRRHPFLAHLLSATARVPESEWQLKHRLGTHVLQQALLAYGGGDFTLLPPEAFYPLGPEISRQYFRFRKCPEHMAQRLLTERTFAIHWYASVKELTSFDAKELMTLSDKSLFGYLCAPYVESRLGLA